VIATMASGRMRLPLSGCGHFLRAED
jgi:hypothetical protein